MIMIEISYETREKLQVLSQVLDNFATDRSCGIFNIKNKTF